MNKYPMLVGFNSQLVLAGPSGQHCRCYGVVDVSARSVFWSSQCKGEVDI